MTQITYNDVTIKDVLTHSVDQDVAYDVDGQVDQWYVKTTVTIQFTFHTVSGAGLGFSTGASLAGGTAQALKMLTTNRKRFTMSIGGETLFDVTPGATREGVTVEGGATFDVNNGPRPKLQIQEIIGTKVARGTFTVELAVPSCDGYSDGLMSLRWWTTDDVDGNWMTTRTINGRLRVSTKNNNPHFLRGLIFPPLQRGFRRESMTFTEDPNGLELAFIIRDLEVYRSAPFPASKWRGNHRMISQVPGLTVVESECSVTLEGAHDVPQTLLIALGFRIIDTKLLLTEQGLLTGNRNDGKAIIMFFAVDAELGENKATVMCRIKHTGQGSGGVTFLPQAQQLGISLPPDITFSEQGTYDPLVSRLLPGPTSPLVTIVISKLQTPCAPATMETGVPVSAEQEAATRTPAEVTVITGEVPPDTNSPGFSPEHQEAPYTSYRVVSRIQTYHGKAAMEIAAASSSSEDDDVIPVDLTRGRTYRRLMVTATRISQPPQMLNPRKEFFDEFGRKHTLMNEGYGDKGQDTVGKDEHFWQIQHMTYLVSKKTDLPVHGFQLTLAPWLKDGDQTKKIVPEFFQTDPAGG